MILDLFAGPGGWDEGLALLDRHDLLGLELDPDACATATAAGFARRQCDIREVDPKEWATTVTGLIASPPCQTFSDAGKGEGQASLGDLVAALALVADGTPADQAATRCGLDAGDPRSTLVLEPMRFLIALRPRWVAFEEVTQVLPVWQGYAPLLRRLGYSVWTGILNAADYGVPQTRKRAFLLASRDTLAHPPEPTHAANAEPSLFGQRAPWVTMAEALAWGPGECVEANAKAPAAARDPERSMWALDRPATTVVRSFRPDVIAAPGYRLPGDGPRQNTPGSLAVTPEQMAILQGVRPDYPFTANGANKRLSLVGAMLPPPWAAAILAPLVDAAQVMCTNCGYDGATRGADQCSDCIEEWAS